jgi:hypothetical protein
MNNKIRTWGLLIAVLATSMSLAGLNISIYQLVILYAAPDTALLILGSSLFLTVAVVGAAASLLLFELGFAYGRERALKNPPKLGEVVAPYETKLAGLTLVRYPAKSFLFRDAGEIMDKQYFERKTFFDDETTRTKLYKWEQQKNTPSAKAMSKFLMREFIILPDGTIHVPTEAFYLWRTRKPKNSNN